MACRKEQKYLALTSNHLQPLVLWRRGHFTLNNKNFSATQNNYISYSKVIAFLINKIKFNKYIYYSLLLLGE